MIILSADERDLNLHAMLRDVEKHLRDNLTWGLGVRPEQLERRVILRRAIAAEAALADAGKTVPPTIETGENRDEP